MPASMHYAIWFSAILSAEYRVGQTADSLILLDIRSFAILRNADRFEPIFSSEHRPYWLSHNHILLFSVIWYKNSMKNKMLKQRIWKTATKILFPISAKTGLRHSADSAPFLGAALQTKRAEGHPFYPDFSPQNALFFCVPSNWPADELFGRKIKVFLRF